MWSRFLESAQDNESGQPAARGLARMRTARPAPKADTPPSRRLAAVGGSPDIPPEVRMATTEPSLKVTNLDELHATTTITQAAAAFLRPVQRHAQPALDKALTPEEQCFQLKKENLALQRQVLIVGAEAEASQKVVDILVDQGDQLRLERESIRLVSRSTMAAADELVQEYQDAIATIAAQRITLKAIASATLAEKKAEIASLHEKSRSSAAVDATAVHNAKSESSPILCSECTCPVPVQSAASASTDVAKVAGPGIGSSGKESGASKLLVAMEDGEVLNKDEGEATQTRMQTAEHGMDTKSSAPSTTDGASPATISIAKAAPSQSKSEDASLQTTSMGPRADSAFSCANTVEVNDEEAEGAGDMGTRADSVFSNANAIDDYEDEFVDAPDSAAQASPRATTAGGLGARADSTFSSAQPVDDDEDEADGSQNDKSGMGRALSRGGMGTRADSTFSCANEVEEEILGDADVPSIVARRQASRESMVYSGYSCVDEEAGSVRISTDHGRA